MPPTGKNQPQRGQQNKIAVRRQAVLPDAQAYGAQGTGREQAGQQQESTVSGAQGFRFQPEEQQAETGGPDDQMDE